MTTILEPNRNTPIPGEYDVVVLGGGPAGIAAAAAAGRAGRSIILIERYGFLGGAGTAAGLSTFCGLHANVHGEHKQVIHGVADEILDRLKRMDALNEPHLSFANKIMAQAYDKSLDSRFRGDDGASGYRCHAVWQRSLEPGGVDFAPVLKQAPTRFS